MSWFRLPLQCLLFLLGSTCFLQASSIRDEANLLREQTRASIEKMAEELFVKTGTKFLLATESRDEITDFDVDAREAFAQFIQDVPEYRGIMLYIQVEQGTDRGKIRFSSGYGLRGIFEFENVRRILKDEILRFREDLSNQQPLVDGIRSYFRVLAELPEDVISPDEESGFLRFMTRDKILWLFGVLFVSFCIVSVIFLYYRTRCPRCSSRVHINIRPLYKRDSQYKRIKIIKCFDCNYFRKYLF